MLFFFYSNVSAIMQKRGLCGTRRQTVVHEASTASLCHGVPFRFLRSTGCEGADRSVAVRHTSCNLYPGVAP